MAELLLNGSRVYHLGWTRSGDENQLLFSNCSPME